MLKNKLDEVAFKTRFFYMLLTVSTVLYIYSFSFGGINLSLFRGLLVFWWLLFLKDIVFLRKTIKSSHLIFLRLFFIIFLINIVDWIRLESDSILAKDIFNHLINMSLVYLVVAYVNSENKINILIRDYIYGSILALYIAIFTWFEGVLPFEWLIRGSQSELREEQNFINSYNLVPRLTSAFTDPSFYGLYLCFVLTLCVYYVNYVQKSKFIIAIFILNFIALVGTMSRTALIGFFIILVVSMVRIPRFAVTILWASPVIASLAVLLVADPEISKSVIALDIYFNTASTDARKSYWENGLRVIGSHPFFGGGAQLLSEDGRIASAHVVYLTLLAKYGIAGFVVYAAFLLYPICYVVKHRKFLSDNYIYLILAVYLSLIVMYLSYDFFQFLEFQYLIFGIVYSIILNRMGRTGARRSTPSIKKYREVEPLRRFGPKFVGLINTADERL